MPRKQSRDITTLPPPSDMFNGREGNDQHSLSGEPYNWPELDHLMGNLKRLLFHPSECGDFQFYIYFQNQGLHSTSPAESLEISLLVQVKLKNTENPAEYPYFGRFLVTSWVSAVTSSLNLNPCSSPCLATLSLWPSL